MRKLFLFLLFLFLTAGICDAQLSKKNSVRKTEKGLFGKSLGKKKEVKVKEPGAVVKAKKKQEAKERKMKSNKSLSFQAPPPRR